MATVECILDMDIMRDLSVETRTWLVKTAVVERRDDIVIITLPSRLSIFNAPSLVKQFNGLFDEGATRFIVDLSDVRIVDGDGDYPLLHLLKRTLNVGGRILLVCPEDNPVRILYDMMGFDQLFEIVETLDVALAEMR